MKLISKYNGMIFIIEVDKKDVGAYLLVFKDNICIYDYLQNDVNACIEFAADEFSVPNTSWDILKETE